MRNILLASAALGALLLAAPAVAQHHDRHGDNATTPDTTPATGTPTPPAGTHAHGGHGHDNAHATTPTPPPGAPAMIPGTPILAPGAGGQGAGGHHDNNHGHDNNTGGHDNNAGRGDAHNTGNNSGRDNNRWNGQGTHAGRGHNSAFDAFRRVFNAPRHYRHGAYHRPSGWYAHRWSYGEFLPALFFSRNYWISDYEDFDLSDPPPGTVWVRYGNDALLIDEDSGEVIQVVYGLFY